MRRRAWFLFTVIASTVVAATALPASAQQAVQNRSRYFGQFGGGVGTSAGGQFVNRVSVSASQVIGKRYYQRPRATLLAAISAQEAGWFSGNVQCTIPVSTSSYYERCPPIMPDQFFAGVLVGVEKTCQTFCIDALVGPGVVAARFRNEYKEYNKSTYGAQGMANFSFQLLDESWFLISVQSLWTPRLPNPLVSAPLARGASVFSSSLQIGLRFQK